MIQARQQDTYKLMLKMLSHHANIGQISQLIEDK